MSNVGRQLNTYELALCAFMAFVAAITGIYQILFLRQLKIAATVYLPLLSVCIIGENVILSLGDAISPSSEAAYFAYVLQSLQIPLFLVFLNELCYYIHKVRGLQYFFMEFNEETLEVDYKIGFMIVQLIRIVALGLLAMNILVNFDLLPGSNLQAGNGGYIYLAHNRTHIVVWLALLPPMVLSFATILLSYMISRFGMLASWSSGFTSKWRYMMLCSIIYTLAHVSDTGFYFWTSNLGEVILLIGSVHLLRIVVKDLERSAQFSDFLLCSNIAFQHVEQRTDQERASPLRAPIHMAVRFNRESSKRDRLTQIGRQTDTPTSFQSYNSSRDGLGLIEIELVEKEQVYPTLGSVYGCDEEAPVPSISSSESPNSGVTIVAAPGELRRILSKDSSAMRVSTPIEVHAPISPEAKQYCHSSPSEAHSDVV